MADQLRQPPLLQGELAPYLAGRGYLVEVRQDEGALHVYPCQAGFDLDKRVVFPRHLRQLGARFAVQELFLDRISSGAFYRTRGKVWKVVDGQAGEELARGRPLDDLLRTWRRRARELHAVGDMAGARAVETCVRELRRRQRRLDPSPGAADG